MKYGINTLDDFNYKSKVTICRLDLNSPYNKDKNALKDTTRIEAAIPTIKELSEKGAKLVLLSHQGGDLEYQNYVSTKLHSVVISNLLGKSIKFIDDVCGPAARDAISSLAESEILLLDNVRYMAEELTLFETKLKLSAVQQAKTLVVSKIAPLADLYVCDAFAAAHRDQPTLVGFEQLLPSAMGRLFEKEYEALSKILKNPEKPCLFVLGGAKIEDAFDMLPKVLKDKVADKIILSGLLAPIFLLADGVDIGATSIDLIYAKKLDSYIFKAKELLSNYREQILVPIDYAYKNDMNERNEIDSAMLPATKLIVDIGSRSINKYKDEIKKAATIFVNGPAGIFEDTSSELGTKEIFNAVANSGAYSVIGGGDSIAAVKKYGLSNKFSYICTGGGAMVRFLSGEELPVVRALKESVSKFK